MLERRCVSRSPGFQGAVTEHAVDGVRTAGVVEPVGGEVTRLDDTSCPLRPAAECPERKLQLRGNWGFCIPTLYLWTPLWIKVK